MYRNDKQGVKLPKLQFDAKYTKASRCLQKVKSARGNNNYNKKENRPDGRTGVPGDIKQDYRNHGPRKEITRGKFYRGFRSYFFRASRNRFSSIFHSRALLGACACMSGYVCEGASAYTFRVPWERPSRFSRLWHEAENTLRPTEATLILGTNNIVRTSAYTEGDVLILVVCVNREIM